MRYLGSKVSVIEDVYELISQKIPKGTFCDPFGGIGIVGSFFKAKGYSVWTGDILNAAYHFQVARVQLNQQPIFKQLKGELGIRKNTDLFKLLNSEKPKSGWITKHFSKKRQFFTEENAKRIDTCRLLIANWSRNGWLNKDEQSFLLASLINSMDKVANTAGTYYAYLKTWYRKALKPFQFEAIQPTKGNTECRSFLGEAKDLVNNKFFDVLYLDPPYNERCYSRYYHLPESIALEQTPKTNGLSGVPHFVGVSSDFNKPYLAHKALAELLEKSRFRLLVFHYSDDGIIPPDDIRNTLKFYGKVEEVVINSKGYTTAKIPRVINHRVYLINNG